MFDEEFDDCIKMNMTRQQIITAVWELHQHNETETNCLYVTMTEIETAYDNYVLSLARRCLAANEVQ